MLGKSVCTQRTRLCTKTVCHFTPAVAPQPPILPLFFYPDACGLPHVACWVATVLLQRRSYSYCSYSLSKLNHGAQPSEAGCKRSVEAAWRYLTTELQVPAQDIVIFGRSIGSGPAVHLASRQVRARREQDINLVHTLSA